MQQANGGPYLAQAQFHKVDTLYFNAVQLLKKRHIRGAVYQLVKALIFIIFIPIDYTILKQPNSTIILLAMILAIVVSILQLMSQAMFLIPLKNLPFLLKNAEQTTHSTSQTIQNPSSLKQCKSQIIYNQLNQTRLDSQGLTDDIRNSYETIQATHISQYLQTQYQGLDKFDGFAKFTGFTLFIFAIVALSLGQFNTPELVLLIIFIIMEGLSKIIVLAVFVLILLAPILCCLFCIFACCCRSFDQQVQLPQAQKATQQMIIQAQGTCSICYQDFAIGDNTIKLKCSPKHMFHPLCIQSWSRVKATCPMCRKQIQ